jgi:signal transduction histidine kinase
VATTWTDAGHERVAAFLGLPPGRYVFEVTARTSEGTWNPVSATAEFVVPAAWWQTLWFRLGVVIALIAGAAAVARFVAVRRMRQQLRLEEERARIAQDMHDELGARLTRIELLSEQARQEPTPARLEKISRTAHEVAQTLDEIVWTVNPRNDTLERLLGYLSEYATEYLANTGIELVQDLPENIPAFPLRSDARHNVLLAVKEALNNVVKHAAATRLELRVRLDDDRLQIQITDNGRGFAGENATGHGLENMRQRLTAVGGDCQVTSQPGQGTTVKLTLPVSNKDQRF